MLDRVESEDKVCLKMKQKPMMTGTPGAELCNVLELGARSAGLNSYGISIYRTHNLYAGTLRWRIVGPHADAYPDPWLAMSISLAEYDYVDNESFVEWKFRAQEGLKRNFRDLKEEHGGYV